MLYIDLHNDETGQTIRIGTLAEFVDLFIAETGSVATVMLKGEYRKRALSALDRVIQRTRDNAKIQR